MPESKVRKPAVAQSKAVDAKEPLDERTDRQRLAPTDRSWVPWVFIPVGLLGVAWLVVYYIAGVHVPLMRDLHNWNILIGMGLLAASFGIATLWT